MVTLAPAIMDLSTSWAVCTPLVSARSALTRAVQDGDPAQGQAQFVRGAQVQGRHHFQRFDIQVGLVEAVEQHQAVGAGFDQACGKVGQGGEERAELDRQGDVDLLAHIRHQVDVGLFQLLAGQVRVGGNVVDVQLQRIRAGLFDLLGIIDPAAGGDAVQAADDRDVDRCL